jgi:hypothetical protein
MEYYHPYDERAPAGVFTVSATFTNISTSAIADPFFQVTRLTGGHVLLNADGGPGGVDAVITVPPAALNADETLGVGASFTIDFEIGLQAPEGFDFTVDAYGTPIGGTTTASHQAGSDRESFQFTFDDSALTASGSMLYLPLISK